MRKLCITAAVILAGTAQAVAQTTYNGTLKQVQANVSTTAGNAVLSIQTSGTTACTGTNYPGWYTFDMPTNGVGAIWEAMLLSAVASGGSVTIYGSGSCNSFGLEIVSYMAVP
jgi:hypothetical protein